MIEEQEKKRRVEGKMGLPFLGGICFGGWLFLPSYPILSYPI